MKKTIIETYYQRVFSTGAGIQLEIGEHSFWMDFSEELIPIT